MKVKLTRILLGFVLALGLTSSALAQAGYVDRLAPQQFINYGDTVYYVCTYASTAANCSSNTITIANDNALSGTITQTSGVALANGGQVKFYASPGLYHILYSSTVAGQKYLSDVIVPADVNSASNGATDGFFWVPANQCVTGASVGANTGTTSSPDGLYQLEGSAPNALPVLIAKRTAAGTSHSIFYCAFQVPSRILAGKGVKITDVTWLYSQQGTATGLSMIAAVFSSFTGPAAGTSETASSATLVAAGGAITATPAVASANLTAITAAQYYSQKFAWGTPVNVNSDLQVFQAQFEIDQANSTAVLLSTPGFYVHYTLNPY